MIVALDVQYEADAATAACVGFNDWPDEKAAFERVVKVSGVAPYEPGAFYKRELPCLLEVLKDQAYDLVIVDGYAWLGANRKGLGAHLHDAIGKPVIGVAKTSFRGAEAIEVRKLFVTAAGTDPAEAAKNVERMHGPHRVPTLLRRVDRLARTG